MLRYPSKDDHVSLPLQSIGNGYAKLYTWRVNCTCTYLAQSIYNELELGCEWLLLAFNTAASLNKIIIIEDWIVIILKNSMK